MQNVCEAYFQQRVFLMKAFVGLVFFGVLAALPVGAETSGEGLTQRDIERIKADPPRAKRSYMSYALELEPSGVIGGQTLEMERARGQARWRAQFYQEAFSYDTDADGKVSLLEAKAAAARAASGDTSRLRATELLKQADANEDGIVEFSEVHTFAVKSLRENNSNSRSIVRIGKLLSMDMNSDGKTELSEIIGFIDKIAASDD